MTAPILHQELIGSRSPARTLRVESGQLKFFAKATDQRDPVYFDLNAAQAAGYPGLPVPLTFAFSLTLVFPDQAAFGLVQVKADPRYILHAEQGFRYHGMLFGEEEVTLQTRIQNVYEKKNGALFFIAQTTELANSTGRLCVECNTTFVLRTSADARHD